MYEKVRSLLLFLWGIVIIFGVFSICDKNFLTNLQIQAQDIQAKDIKAKDIQINADVIQNAVSSSNNNQEKILLFESTILINTDTLGLDINEKIVVNVEHDIIKHGIYRDLPLIYKTKDTGETYRVQFELLSTALDGRPVNYQIKRIKNGIRIYLGDPNYYVSKGIHTYTIKYQVKRVLGVPSKYPNTIELYWNIIGNDWEFPVNKVLAKIEIPSNVDRSTIRYTAYVGLFGSNNNTDYKAYFQENHLVFETTRSLMPKENLTIAILFPKEMFNISSNWSKQQTLIRIQNNIGLIFALILFGVVSLFAYKTWSYIGKDTKLSSIMPIFKSPIKNPALIRYVYKIRDYYTDSKTLSAYLVYLAVNGYIKILEPKKGKFKLQLVKLPSQKNSLEYKFLNALFKDNQELDLTQRDFEISKKLTKALKIVQNDIKKIDTKIYISNNVQMFKYVFFYIISLLASAILGFLNYEISQDSLFLIFWFMIMLFVIGLMVAFAIRNVSIKKQSFLQRVIFLVSVIFLVAFIIIGNYWAFVVALYFIGIIYIVLLFPRLTEYGVQLYQDILGFKMYLETAEKDRLNVLNSVDKAIKLFEQYLPYAIALDVEHKWAKHFKKVFDQIQNNQNKKQLTPWYDGVYNMTLNDRLESFSHHLGTSLASTITSAGRLNSASSGGFTGGYSGGFSGGGGGGGGGGGW